MPKISAIIPVYNAEKYLSRCLSSLSAQTFADFEIILVNDGSTDKSQKIINEYAKADSRFIQITIKNGGVSNARNIGLENAKGEFVYFLDGDDWIEPETLQILYENIGECDMAQAAYEEVLSDGKTVPYPINDITVESQEDILGSYFLHDIRESCWNKLYRRETIGDLRFDVNLSVAEDAVFVYSFIKKSRKIKIINRITYHYYINAESCMHSKLKEVHFYPLVLRDEYLREWKDNKNLYKKCVSFEIHTCFVLLRQILFSKSEEFYHKIKDLRKRVVTKKRFVLFSPYYSLRIKIGVLLLWLCPKLFCKIYSK